ncbi:MAG TPA: hypothetical protein VIN40_02090 [Candidatus Tyrphobacter sp.]
MSRQVFAFAALAGMLFAAGCGGGFSGGNGGGIPPHGGHHNPNAQGNITFRIPAVAGHAVAPSSGAHSRGAQSVRPQYVSAETSAMTLTVDGTVAVNDVAIPNLGTEATPPPNASGSCGTLPNGQSCTYSFVLGTNQDQGYYVGTITVTLIPGPHTIGIVLQDTPANNNFVLSEGQATYTLVPGANAPATLFLEGVMDSAFLCDAACDGNIGAPGGQLGDGSYNIVAYACDEGGWCIPYQTNVNPVPFDNGGSYSLTECDTVSGKTCTGNTGIVKLETCDSGGSTPVAYGANGGQGLGPPAACTPAAGSGPFNIPGQYRYTNQGTSVNYLMGMVTNIKCLTPGSTNVAMVYNGLSSGGVTGFPYNSSNYPTTGQIISSVPAYPSFGNVIAVNCSANLTITLQ